MRASFIKKYTLATGFLLIPLLFTSPALAAQKHILQGGNTYKTNVVIGTTNDYGINLITDNATVESLSSTGQAVFKNTANSTSAFQIQNASGASLFTADTTNGLIGIDTSSPEFPLDVNGAINTNTALLVDGNVVCQADGCIAAPGSGSGGSGGNFIQNSTTLQLGNIALETNSPSSPTLALRATPSQTADLLDVQNSIGTNVLAVSTNSVTVSANTIINGHVQSGNTSGNTTVTPDNSIATATISGNDTAGQVTITTGLTPPLSGEALATVNFANPYSSTPYVVISNDNYAASQAGTYTGSVSSTGFSLLSGSKLAADTSYVYTYYVIQ